MANDREKTQQQPDSGGSENDGRKRQEQFNELSELSLEERIAVADKIGIPAARMSDAVALGPVSVRGDDEDNQHKRIEEESTDEGSSR